MLKRRMPERIFTKRRRSDLPLDYDSALSALAQYGNVMKFQLGAWITTFNRVVLDYLDRTYDEVSSSQDTSSSPSPEPDEVGESLTTVWYHRPSEGVTTADLVCLYAMYKRWWWRCKFSRLFVFMGLILIWTHKNLEAVFTHKDIARMFEIPQQKVMRILLQLTLDDESSKFIRVLTTDYAEMERELAYFVV